MERTDSPGRIGRILRVTRREWRSIGGLGRLGLLGVGASLIVAVALGFSITRAAERQILDAQAALLENVARDLATLAPLGGPGEIADNEEFDAEVRLRLLGGETIGVKLWLSDGTIAYSDDDTIVGGQFHLGDHAAEAFTGEPVAVVVDTSDPAHFMHRDLDELVEFFIPFGPGEEPSAVFEVEQRVDSLNSAVGRISRNVWLSISTGLIVLGMFLTSLLVARTRDLDRRREEAERLFGDLLRAQDEERRRVVGSLHDDVGQPLYRLHYGLEGSIAKLQRDHPVREELDRMRDLVGEVDDTLRAELRVLHEGFLSDAGLEAALEDLAESTRRETAIDVALSVSLAAEPSEVPRTALYRAIREGITNARKHSEASRIEIRVVEENGHISAEVADDGRGAGGRHGLGLTTSRERLETIGGGLSLDTTTGGGTAFRVWVPVHQGRSS